LVPVEIPGFGTKQTISDTEVLLGILSAAVNRKQRGVLRFLERAELKEPDVWFRDDYRMAQQIVTLSDEGKGNAYSKAFFQVFSRDASQTRFWWRDRDKLYRLCELGGSNTPLLHANLAKELDKPAVIPDYDYSVSSDRAVPPGLASKGNRPVGKSAAKSVEYPDDSLVPPSARALSGESARPQRAVSKKRVA